MESLPFVCSEMLPMLLLAIIEWTAVDSELVKHHISMTLCHCCLWQSPDVMLQLSGLLNDNSVVHVVTICECCPSLLAQCTSVCSFCEWPRGDLETLPLHDGTCKVRSTTQCTLAYLSVEKVRRKLCSGLDGCRLYGFAPAVCGSPRPE